MERPRFTVGTAALSWALLLALLGVCCTAASADEAAISMKIPHVAAAPPVDGTLSSPIWQQGTKVALAYDRQNHGPAQEPTTAYLLTDGQNLYVGFDAVQTRTPILTTQHTNMNGVDTDDEVKISLWPAGTHGNNYQFISTPLGTRYQYSSENLTYEPTWDAVAHIGNHEWTVTMRIPLRVMRGARHDTWLVNLTRWEPTTQSLYVWSGGPNFAGTADTNYARPMLEMPDQPRPQPRIGVYGLGSLASGLAGGSTSRMGADLSIPITSGTSFIAALHPDFSNAEQDQATIAPTALRRFLNETRPFFTQGANFYNNFEYDAAPTEQLLYTPAIPTPRDGYAIEGKEGPFTFAGFNAIGTARNDNAQSLVYTTRPRNLYISAERVSASLPGIRDVAMEFGTKWDDLKHKFLYLDYGTESGSFVTDPAKGKFIDFGGGFYGPHSFTGGGIRKIGAQFNPLDGFFSNNDLAGYGLFSQHTWTPNGGYLRSLQGSAFVDNYYSSHGLNAQSDYSFQIDAVTRNLWELVANTGSSYLLINGAVVPVTQQGEKLVYHSGTATPTQIQYLTGRYGAGRLDSWFRSTTMKVGERGLLSLEADNTRQYLDHPLPDGSTTLVQWLERASIAYTFDRNTSLVFGVRRYFGPPPIPNNGSGTCFVARPNDPNALGFCPNVSLAFYKRMPHDELYVIYGNASANTTVPQFLVKYIHYFGAEKGI
ncbi:MAG: hypothetical protein JO193_01005 [Candidatus Eremiobacteraeota bacterium]|nr:hypothetical protein [Candidatus Eremiobacteraeota bacterium]